LLAFERLHKNQAGVHEEQHDTQLPERKRNGCGADGVAGHVRYQHQQHGHRAQEIQVWLQHHGPDRIVQDFQSARRSRPRFCA
jgi:hypothetical protein